MKDTLTTYLRRYYEFQEKIMLCYRETNNDSWADRCQYLGLNYNSTKPYNHRSILYNEIVIEYDDPNPKVNEDLASQVCSRLTKDSMSWSKWRSGNKSVHVHFFIKLKEVVNISLLKRSIIKHYTKDLPIPDLRLTAENHLIRAEFGIHEATGKHKELISKSKDYPRLNYIPNAVWDRYKEAIKINFTQKIGIYSNSDLTKTKGFKFLIRPEEFQQIEDGRERTLFMLIHILKGTDKFKEDKYALIEFLKDWYRYSGGFKLSDKDIELKVSYHWNRDYSITENYLNNLLEELGLSNLIEKKEEKKNENSTDNK